MLSKFKQLLQTVLAFAVLEENGKQFFGLPDDWKVEFITGLPDFRRRLVWDNPYLAIAVVRNKVAVARGRWDAEGREQGQFTATLDWLMEDGRTDHVERNIFRLDAEKFLPGDTLVIRFLSNEGPTTYPILAALRDQAADEWVHAREDILNQNGYEVTGDLQQLRQEVMTRMASTQMITHPPLPA